MAKNIATYEHYIPAVREHQERINSLKTHLIKSIEELKKLFEENKAKLMSLDFETSDLDPDNGFIVGFSVAFSSDEGYYIPVKHAVGNNLGKDSLDLLYKALLESKKVFFYNYKFDIRWLYKLGYDIQVIKYLDVMECTWLSDTNVKLPSLKKSTLHFLGYMPPTFEETVGANSSFYYVNPEDGYKYACYDAIGTFALVAKTFKFYQEGGISSKIDNNILMPFVVFEDNGVNIDIDYVKARLDEIEPALAKLESEIYATVGYPFTLKSPKQLGEALISVGITTGVYTATGQMKTDINTLTAVSKKLGNTEETKLLTKLVEYSKLKKMQSSFFGSLYDEAVRQKGKCRFSYIHFNVPSGRLASGSDKKNTYFTHMNIQALSKPEPCMYYVHELKDIDLSTITKDEIIIRDWLFSTWRKADVWAEGFDQHLNLRSSFLPDKGCLWVAIDFNAQELRIPAAISGEPAWVRPFTQGGDVHAETACQIWGKENYDKHKRKMAKVASFSQLYGGNAHTYVEKLEIPLDEAQKLVDDFKKGLPTLFQWVRTVERRAEKVGTVYSYFGRPRRVKFYMESANPKLRAYGRRTIINDKIQATAADITKLSILRMWNKLLNPKLNTGVRFMNTIHDEIDLSIPNDENFIHNLLLAKKCMEFTIPNWQCQMKAEPSIGTCWGKCFDFNVNYKDGTISPKVEAVPTEQIREEALEEVVQEEQEESIFEI